MRNSMFPVKNRWYHRNLRVYFFLFFASNLYRLMASGKSLPFLAKEPPESSSSTFKCFFSSSLAQIQCYYWTSSSHKPILNLAFDANCCHYPSHMKKNNTFPTIRQLLSLFPSGASNSPYNMQPNTFHIWCTAIFRYLWGQTITRSQPFLMMYYQDYKILSA